MDLFGTQPYFPRKLSSDAIWKAVHDAFAELDRITSHWIYKFHNLHRPDRTPYPIELARQLFAIISEGASIRDIRIAAHNAPQVTRKPLSWALNWQPQVEAVTGQPARIWLGPFSDDPGAIPVTPTVKYWPTLGYVMIDLGFTAGAPILDALEKLLAPVSESYFKYYLGHTETHAEQSFVIGTAIIANATYVLGDAAPAEYFVIDRALWGAPTTI